MLLFYPSSLLHPWDYLFQNLVNGIPAGSMYAQGVFLQARGTKPTEFILQTDHYVDTQIIINDKIAAIIRPAAALERVRLRLYEPPAGNAIVVDNGIDEPVSLSITVTHQAVFDEVMARQLYEYLNFTIEKIYREMTSPWATFFVEYQLPWRNLLPDVQELRILSVRLASNCLFGEFGLDGAVKDLISSFALSTPAILPAKNPEIFMPDLFNPVTSGDDVAGYVAHVWFPNICINQRLAFQKLINNLDCFIPRSVSEDALIYERAGTSIFRQHTFSDSGPLCSTSKLFDFLGCMDRMIAVLETSVTSSYAISMYAQPFDQRVMPPGIGGKFFDSGKTFDGAFGPFDGVYDIDPLTDYWVGAALTHFDSGCADSYAAACPTVYNKECCPEGPQTTTLNTTVNASETTSATTPMFPLFGGQDPGILLNPYFSIPHG